MKRILIPLALLCDTLLSWGQATQVSQIRGVVQDATGAAIPGAEIAVTNIDTGVIRNATSGPDGGYIVPSLPPAAYRLQASKTGFAAYVQNGIVLQVGVNPQINVEMKVGQVSEQVEVQASAALVEIRSNGVGQVIDNERVLELPLNGRQVSQLVTLSGAATDFVPVTAGQSLISNKNYPSSSAFSIAGGQGGQTLFLVDGGFNMDPISNVGLPMPFPDALQEFKVETSSLPANYGNQPGGVVNVVTKSGGNQFHGDAFEFLRNYNFNARNFFAPARDSLKRNQFGGVLGGPILKNKLFFFGGYQATLERVAPAANINFVATQAALQGDFNGIASCGGGTLRAPFVGNKVSPTLLNPVALNLLKLIPTSTDPCGRLTFGIPSRNNENQFVGKADWQMTGNQSLFLRYFITDYQHPPVYKDNLLTMSTDASVGLDDQVQTAVAGHTWTVNPTTISSFRAGFSRAGVVRYTPEGIPTPTSLGSKVFQGVPGYALFAVTNYFQPLCTNCSPGPWISNLGQISEDVSMIRGKHQISVGFNWVRSILTAYGNFSRNGNFTFNGQTTGNSLADFMLGRPSAFTQNNGQLAAERINMPSLYAQDNIKVNSHLTLNVGVRWDPYLSPHKRLPNMVSIFDRSWFDAGLHSKLFSNAPVGTLFPGDAGMPDGQAYYLGRKGEFAPRVGVIFDPRGKGQETIRAGYGLFYGTPPLFLSLGTHSPYASPVAINNPPGGLSDPYTGSPTANPFPLPNPLPTNVSFPAFGGGLGNFKLDPKPMYMQQWNLAVQKQLPHDWLVSATYLGNRTVHLIMQEPLNYAVYIPGNCAAGQFGLTAAGPCSNTANTNFRRLLYQQNPTAAGLYGALNNFGDGANANYNGLLLSVQHRLTNNFTVLANHTWSHCLTENEIQLNGGGIGQDPLNRRAEYGNCLSDRRHVFNLTGVVKTPKFSSAWNRRLLGGWQEATIFTASTGGFSTVTVGTDNSLTANADRPNVVGNAAIASPSIAQWFNTAAFVRGATGTFGNAGRGTILGPGAWNVDIAVSRSFPIIERQRIDFRAEAFNLMNHARFGNPTTAMNSPSYGQILSARDPRILQFALKYIF